MDLKPRPEESVPERFVPATMHGELAEAEHLARYRFAASLVKGRRVLDAGCGMAYGSAILHAGGAARVVGVDVAESVLDAVRDDMPPGVELKVGDVSRLDFDDDTFDAVVCFEVIEHIDDRASALDEFRRVLAPGGLLVLSSPNRDAYVPGNPHHVFEYTPSELQAELASRFHHVGLLRQQGFIGATILEDADLAFDDEREIAGASVTRAVAGEPGLETYTIAVASDAALPEVRPHLVLTGLVEVRHWQELYTEQHELLRRQHEYLDELARRCDEVDELRLRLREAEQLLAVMPELERDAEVGREVRERLDAAEDELERAHLRHDELAAAVARATSVYRGMQESLSWRLTKPLRRLKRRNG